MKVLKIILKTSLFVVGFGIYTFLTMILWNHLVPSIFSLPQINFWQTLGLIVLIKMLFLGHGWGGKYAHHEKRKRFMKHKSDRMDEWKRQCRKKMNEKQANIDTTESDTEKNS